MKRDCDLGSTVACDQLVTVASSLKTDRCNCFADSYSIVCNYSSVVCAGPNETNTFIS